MTGLTDPVTCLWVIVVTLKLVVALVCVVLSSRQVAKAKHDLRVIQLRRINGLKQYLVTNQGVYAWLRLLASSLSAASGVILLPLIYTIIYGTRHMFLAQLMEEARSCAVASCLCWMAVVKEREAGMLVRWAEEQL
jgi:hypothetical protein